MAVGADELRALALVMGLAYGAMGAFGFAPGWRARRAAGGAVRSARRVSPAVEALWVGVQAVIIGSLAAAYFAPTLVLSAPLSQLSASAPALAVGGALLFCAGAALAAWAARHLSAELTVAIETREGGRLVTSGPYAKVRHPIYTGIIAMVGGLSVALGSPLVALWVPVAAYCATVRARLEEELLSVDAAHGAEYRTHMGRSGRFWPRRRP